MSILTFIAILIIGGPICKALAVRISRGSGTDSPTVRRALEEMEQRLVEGEDRLADAVDRLVEVEERLDFSERILAQQNSNKQLGS
jgi:hypothetical protein